MSVTSFTPPALAGEKWGRYSIIGLPSRTIIRVAGKTITVTENGELTQTIEVDDPMAWLGDHQHDVGHPERVLVGAIPERRLYVSHAVVSEVSNGVSPSWSRPVTLETMCMTWE